MTERRRFLRRRTLLDGRIAVERLNGFVLDCAVRNLSPAGARLTLPARAIVPETFALTVSTGRPQTARLVWYKQGQAGIALLDGLGQPATGGEPPVESRPAAIDLQARIEAIASGRRTGGPARPQPGASR